MFEELQQTIRRCIPRHLGQFLATTESGETFPIDVRREPSNKPHLTIESEFDTKPITQSEFLSLG